MSVHRLYECSPPCLLIDCTSECTKHDRLYKWTQTVRVFTDCTSVHRFYDCKPQTVQLYITDNTILHYRLYTRDCTSVQYRLFVHKDFSSVPNTTDCKSVHRLYEFSQTVEVYRLYGCTHQTVHVYTTDCSSFNRLCDRLQWFSQLDGIHQPNDTLKMFVKKVFLLVKPFLANLHSTISKK
jgi:hypothetical protein